MCGEGGKVGEGWKIQHKPLTQVGVIAAPICQQVPWSLTAPANKKLCSTHMSIL